MQHFWRLIIDGGGDAYHNMAVDEALLSCYPMQRIPTLRIYGWSKPSFSIGYKQNPHRFLYDDCRLRVVRRITGGGAILHDKEITYSLTCAYTDLNLPAGVKAGYRIICSFLKDFYQRCGLTALFACEAAAAGSMPYGDVCFSSWHEFDMVVDGKKIGGNAQRRQKDIIFQHGSIPQRINYLLMQKSLRHSKLALSKTAALDDVLGRKTDFCALQALLAQSFSCSFGVTLHRASLQGFERQAAQRLVKQKYSRACWNQKHA